jgi:hypothetical protein
MTERPQEDHAKTILTLLIGYFLVGPLLLTAIVLIGALIGWLA